MKKKLIIIGTVLIVCVLIIATILKININRKSLINREISTININVSTIANYFKKYDYPNRGTANISANYRGAHGENFPHEFNYNFSLEDNILYLEEKKGFNKLEINERIIDLISNLQSCENFILLTSDTKTSATKVEKELDIANINKTFNTNYQSGKIVIEATNIFFNELKKAVIYLDDIVINIEDNIWKIKTKDNDIKMTLTKKGYSLSANDNFKMNVFFENNRDRYNIVYNSYVYSLEASASHITFVANTPASIYNSLKVKFTFDEEAQIKKNKELDSDTNPLTRYFKNVE